MYHICITTCISRPSDTANSRPRRFPVDGLSAKVLQVGAHDLLSVQNRICIASPGVGRAPPAGLRPRALGDPEVSQVSQVTIEWAGSVKWHIILTRSQRQCQVMF